MCPFSRLNYENWKEITQQTKKMSGEVASCGVRPYKHQSKLTNKKREEFYQSTFRQLIDEREKIDQKIIKHKEKLAMELTKKKLKKQMKSG